MLTTKSDKELLHKLCTLKPLVKPDKYPCRGCYWGKQTGGHKITCFWQKCRRGGRV